MLLYCVLKAPRYIYSAHEKKNVKEGIVKLLRKRNISFTLSNTSQKIMISIQIRYLDNAKDCRKITIHHNFICIIEKYILFLNIFPNI